MTKFLKYILQYILTVKCLSPWKLIVGFSCLSHEDFLPIRQVVVILYAITSICSFSGNYIKFSVIYNPPRYDSRLGINQNYFASRTTA